MKKLNVAIIGQGRSGCNIHGRYFRSEKNEFYTVKYVVEADTYRREKAEGLYPGCKTFEKYTDLFGLEDIDLVVNATYSEMHGPITKDLLLHGFNVLVEKPFARTRYECDELIKIAKEKNLVLAVFHQTLHEPYFQFAYNTAKSGKLGRILQVQMRYNGFSRRWDWQTLQKKCAGGTYNTGPHPIGIGMGFLDFSDDVQVVYSKLDSALTSGDADDYAKILLTAPGKPLVDIEINSVDAYSDYNLKIVGTRGTLKSGLGKGEMTYIIDGENPEQPLQEDFLRNANGDPIYCTEDLIKHTEEFEFDRKNLSAPLYESLYHRIVDGTPMYATPEIAAKVISVIETAHAQNPMPVKF